MSSVKSSIRTINDCAAIFTAWYERKNEKDKPSRLRKGLQVVGGSCETWPGKAVLFAPTDVRCSRNMRDQMTITIDTESGSSTQTLAALSSLGPEPTAVDHWEIQRTKAAQESFQVGTLNWINANEGVNYGNYFYYDATPTKEPGTVQSADVVCDGCGAHTWLCPDRGVCSHPLSEIPKGQNVVRVWMHTNSNNPSTLTKITLHYLADENVCTRNCDYPSLHAAWIAENARTCPASGPR